MLKLYFFSDKFFSLQKFIIIPFLLFLFTENGFAEWDIEGSLRARGILSYSERLSNPLFLGQGKFFLKGEYHPSNRFRGRIQFLAANPYGKNSFKDFFRVFPSGSWFINKDLELKLGRTTYQNNFHQIVSINDYEPFFNVFDGAFLEYSANVININFWGAHLPKRWVGAKEIQEFKYGFGFFMDIKSISDYVDHFNIHAAYLGETFFKKDSENMSRYGFGLQGTINPINLSYTFVAVGHSKGIKFIKIDEDMYHIQLNYSYPDFFNSNVFAGYHTDSSVYSPWLYDHHKNAGLMNLFLWGNLTYYFFGFSSELDSLFNMEISFYDFLPKKGKNTPGRRVGFLYSRANKNSINLDNQSLGRELDVKFEKKIRKNFEIQLLAGLFIRRSTSKSILKKEDFLSNVQLTGLYKF